jgi:hypothetical protein
MMREYFHGLKYFISYRGEYCLSNHIESEDLCDVSIDPEPGKQRHGEVHHVLGPSGLPHHDARTLSQGGGLYHDPEPSRSRVCAVFFEEVPHLIDFEDDRLPAGSRLFSVVSGIVANPGQDRAGPHAKHLR